MSSKHHLTMRAITYSWIGLSAAAPLIFLMCAWVLGVFHSYRRQWRSVDLFLLAVFVQELLMALQIFAYALLSLMQPESSAACGAFVWSLSATRTLQVATVASLLVDRALTSQWPYKYRFSVRPQQIRYHLAVLAIIAALVGAAASLVRPSNTPHTFEHCSFLPHALHVSLSLFVLSVYGLLLVIGGVSVVVVQAGRGCNHLAPPHSDMAPITATTSSTTSSRGQQDNSLQPSSASTTSSNASFGRLSGANDALQAASSTSDLVPPPPPHKSPPVLPGRPHYGVGVNRSVGMTRTPATDFRWSTTVAVAALCFLTNHLPYMGMMAVGTFMPSFLPSWPVENIALWLSLAEGLLLPPLLGLVDATFSNAAGSSCSREKTQSQIYDANGQGQFRLFPKEEIKSFPLTNGSLFSSLLNMNVDKPSQILPTYRRAVMPGMKMGLSSQENRGKVSGKVAAQTRLRESYGPPYYPKEATESMSSETTSSHDPIYSHPLSKVDSVESSLKEDHIYATLSETFSSLSSLSDEYLADDHRCSSLTTVANDDFEFHNPRASVAPETIRYTSEGCTESEALVARPPAELPPEAHHYSHEDAYHLSTLTTESSNTYSMASSFRSSSSQVTATIESHVDYIKEDERIADETSSSIGYYNTGFECDTLELKKEYFRERGPVDSLDLRLGLVNEDTVNDGTLSRKHRSSSLSMNDLDRLDSNPEKEEEMMFILPVKSESMLSLYRLYLAEDETGTSLHYSVDVSRSEGDLSVLAVVEGISVGEGRSESALHEVYQKRRIPETTSSKVKRQHKIQRAKGMQRAAKRAAPAPPSSGVGGGHGMQVAIVDKARRRNGIITIQDPSVLSVEELFRVLNRASSTPAVPYSEGDECSVSPHPTPPHRQEPDYKKIFVSEYL